MADPTYVPILTYTAASNVGEVILDNLPQTYSHLILVVNHQVAANTIVTMRFNSDSGANYTNTQIWGNGTSITTAGASSSYTGIISSLQNANSQSNGMSFYEINNYSRTDRGKAVLSKHANPGLSIIGTHGRWNNTAAITRITLTTNTSVWTNGATFELFGIAG